MFQHLPSAASPTIKSEMAYYLGLNSDEVLSWSKAYRVIAIMSIGCAFIVLLLASFSFCSKGNSSNSSSRNGTRPSIGLSLAMAIATIGSGVCQLLETLNRFTSYSNMELMIWWFFSPHLWSILHQHIVVVFMALQIHITLLTSKPYVASYIRPGYEILSLVISILLTHSVFYAYNVTSHSNKELSTSSPAVSKLSITKYLWAIDFGWESALAMIYVLVIFILAGIRVIRTGTSRMKNKGITLPYVDKILRFRFMTLSFDRPSDALNGYRSSSDQTLQNISSPHLNGKMDGSGKLVDQFPVSPNDVITKSSTDISPYEENCQPRWACIRLMFYLLIPFRLLAYPISSTHPSKLFLKI